MQNDTNLCVILTV